jgi:hypothetical protein
LLPAGFPTSLAPTSQPTIVETVVDSLNVVVWRPEGVDELVGDVRW